MLPLALVLAQSAPRPILLDVDATEAPRCVLRVRETFPDAKGRVRLSLPKWIPGDHSPTGTINSIVRLHFYAGDRDLAWTRDPKDLFTFRVDVPNGGTLRAEFVVAMSPGDHLAPKLGRIRWHSLVLLPPGDARRLTIRPTLQAPPEWKVQTALLPTPTGSRVEFAPVSAERLVDSPAQIGLNARSVELAPGYWLDLLADEPAQIDLKPDTLAAFRGLVNQTQRLIRAKHFNQYRFLCTFSDHLKSVGLEHHESSENGLGASGLQDMGSLGDLVSHEMFHSWNGKYRRPKGLATRDFGMPYDDELLWVYEGLTKYYDLLLAVRSGFRTPESGRDALSTTIAIQAAMAGRAWRPVADTAVSASLLSGLKEYEWTLDRRSADYYAESSLVWLEVDATLRRLTGGRRSLDDFCRAFAGGRDTGPEVRPYVFKDVVRTLNGIAPHDWESLLRSRLYAVHPAPPAEGIEAAGWRLVYNATPNPSWPFATLPGGFFVTPDGKFAGITIDSPAYRAGLLDGTKVLAVNDLPFTPEAYSGELAKRAPLRLKVESGGETRTVDLDYRGGLAYPHLERIEGTPDLFSEILKPLPKKK